MGPCPSAEEIALTVARGETTCEEVTRAALERAAGSNPALNALLHLCPEPALREARALDERRARGETLGPLAGVPFVAKDNLCTEGLPTTCASRMLEGYRPPYDATAVVRVRDAGAVLIGKANLDEFAMGSSTEHSAFGPCRNPLDPSRVPGGSSGGSAAAVAAGFVPLALGSDTGGSVRQPAAFCGLAGLRPTYGRVSRWGLVAFASSLDQVGPLARTVSDAWRLYAALSGVDPKDPTTLDLPAERPEPPPPEVKGLRVGLVQDHLGEGVEGSVSEAVEAAAAALRAGGAEVRELSLPHDAYAVAAYYVLAPAEASSNLARFDGVRYGRREPRPTLAGQVTATRTGGFGEEVKRRILAGTFVLSSGYYEAFYAKALAARAGLRADFAAAFDSVDLLLDPTAPTTAFPLGAKDRDPLAMYLSDAFTIPAALAGLPALSVPRFPAGGGLPAGLQLTGPALSERRLCAAGRFLEEALGGAP